MDKLINLRSKHLVLAVSSMAVMSLAHAGENTTEIEQLRQEVKRAANFTKCLTTTACCNS